MSMQMVREEADGRPMTPELFHYSLAGDLVGTVWADSGGGPYHAFCTHPRAHGPLPARIPAGGYEHPTFIDAEVALVEKVCECVGLKVVLFSSPPKSSVCDGDPGGG